MSLRKEIIKVCDCFFTLLLKGNVGFFPKDLFKVCRILSHDVELTDFFISCSKLDRYDISNADKAFLYTVIYFHYSCDFPLLIDCILEEYKKIRGENTARIFHAWISTAHKYSFNNIFSSLEIIKI